ncbi:GNAT family N-acetyltransferase [Kitasatospora sp. NPDC049285]|uniref:GNAT family N-acetyltransferase n=1 Tax=Kitasatospora sp. NPDC049285 TaxID=3157096 RepID=UPI003430803E
MGWTLTTSLDEFQAAAGEFLTAAPVENTVLLTLLDRLRRDGPQVYGPEAPRYGWWRAADGAVAGATLRTPPFGQRLGRLPVAAAEELAGRLAEAGEKPSGVGGERAAALAFAAAWARHTGAAWELRAGERLYRLAELTPPAAPPGGRARLARPADRALLAHWLRAFCDEAGVSMPVDLAADADRRIAAGTLLVWEDAEHVTAMAGVSPVLAGMSRIGPVYTPADRRGRGYASALTAAGSAHAQAAGAHEVLLYTDLSNPVSNAIYQRIGYRPVGDSAEIEFR